MSRVVVLYARRIILAITLFFGLLVSSCSATADWPRNDGWSVRPGQRVDLNVSVPAGTSDPATFIPVTVIRGAKAGPSLLMVAGVHGFEFAPMLAASQLADAVKPADLSGTLIIVRVAHVSAFEHRSPYVNPFDRKNLNRSFPGSPSGTQTERIAFALSSKVIPTADLVLDVHSGDGAEWLDAFVGVYGGTLSSEFATALAVAKAVGLPNIVRYKMETQKQVDTGRSLNRQAVAAGLPTLLLEIGENGGRDESHVKTLVAGVRRAMVILGMLTVTTGAPKAAQQTNPRCFDGTQSIKAEYSGFWTPAAAGGRWLEKDSVVGVVRDYAGNSVEVIKSPINGFALYGLAGPPVKAGEGVLTIALAAASCTYGDATEN